MNGGGKPSAWDSKRRRASTRKTPARTKRKRNPVPKKATFRAVCGIVRTSLTNPWAAVHFRSTTPSTCGAPTATRCARDECESANPATESGRRKTRTTKCTDIHFHFLPLGVKKKGVPPALRLPHESAHNCPKSHDERWHTGRHERRRYLVETTGRSSDENQT